MKAPASHSRRLSFLEFVDSPVLSSPPLVLNLAHAFCLASAQTLKPLIQKIPRLGTPSPLPALRSVSCWRSICGCMRGPCWDRPWPWLKSCLPIKMLYLMGFGWNSLRCGSLHVGPHHDTGIFVNFPHFGNTELGKLPYVYIRTFTWGCTFLHRSTDVMHFDGSCP